VNDLFAVATCRVCGEQVTRLFANLHAEDHAQRGEFPGMTETAPPGPRAERGVSLRGNRV